MKTEGTIINVIFDAAKGTVQVSSREAVSGSPLGTLPHPTRKGYSFEGWYLGDVPVTEAYVPQTEEDITLTARWAKRKGDKKMTSLRRQKLAVAALALVAVVLLATMFVVNYVVTIFPIEDVYGTTDGTVATEKYYVRKKDGVYALYRRDGSLLPVNDRGYYIVDSGNQYQVNAETGACKQFAVVDYDQSVGELLDRNVDRILMFEQIVQEQVYSIEVDNNKSKPYGFYRNANGDVVIKGYENALFTFEDERFVDLCVGCGYMLTTQKLDLTLPYVPRLADGSVDYAAYGLAEVYDENGELIDKPITYTITKAKSAKEKGIPATDENGNVISYTVLVGDLAPDGSGYYVRRVGYDAVYISDPLLYVGVTEKPLEALITPRVNYPLTLTSASMVYDFTLARIEEYLRDDKLEEKDIDPIVMLSYLDLDSRSNTFYNSIPYMSDLEIMNGYTINGTTVSDVMTLFYNMEVLSCKKLGITPEALKEYGLDKNVFYLSYETCTDTTISKENWEFVKTTMVISQKTKDNTYYVASYLYDMIVEVDQYYMSFLELEDKSWYEQYFMAQDISYMQELDIEIDGQKFNFDFDNAMTYSYYTNSEGKLTLVKFNNGTLYKHPSDNQYYFQPKNETRGYYVSMIDFENGTFKLDSKDQVVYVVDGKELVLEADSSNLVVRCEQFQNANNPQDPHKLDYVINHTYIDDAGVEKSEKISAMANFRRFWIQDWYWLSLEGDVDETDFLRNTGMTVEKYLKANGNNPYATIAFRAEDMAATLNQFYYEDENGKSVKLYTENNTKDIIIRFYRYSERKAMLTIEVITEYDENGNAISHPEKAAGRFYVLSSYLDMLKDDLNKVINGERVERD